MRNTVDAKTFSNALSSVSPLLGRAPISIVNEAHVRFHEGSCTITSTNLEHWMSATVPSDLTDGEDFAFIFSNTKKVAKACQFFDGELTFTLIEGKAPYLVMTCGSESAQFPVSPAEDYPVMPSVEPKQQYSANASDLLGRINRIKYAAQKKADSRPVMKGVRFYSTQLFCVDGYRLAVSEDETLSVQESFVVPVDVMHFLKDMGNCKVEIAVGEKYVCFSGNHLSAYIRRIESADTLTPETAIPKHERESYKINRKEYLRKLTYLKECASGKQPVIVNFSNGSLHVETAAAKYSTAITPDKFCEVGYSFNANLMQDALQQFAGVDEVEIHVLSDCSPITITAEGVDDVALVLPFRRRAA